MLIPVTPWIMLKYYLVLAGGVLRHCKCAEQFSVNGMGLPMSQRVSAQPLPEY